MARPKEFDEAEVLDRALELFRDRGFKQTSFADLTRELGVSRQSLYDTYGDKHELYQAALKRYLDRGLQQIEQMLSDPGPIRTVLKTFFSNTITYQCSQGAHGCLMVNSMIELAHDADTRELAKSHAEAVERLFINRLTVAQKQGELAKSKSPKNLAHFLYNTLIGLAVGVRAFGLNPGLHASADMSLQLLD